MPVSIIRAIPAQYQYHKGLDIPLPNCFIFSQCFKVGINHYPDKLFEFNFRLPHPLLQKTQNRPFTEWPVSLLAHCHPSDQIQVALQRLRSPNYQVTVLAHSSHSPDELQKSSEYVYER